MQTFTVSDVRRETRRFAPIETAHALPQRLTVPLSMDELFRRPSPPPPLPPAIEAYGCPRSLVVAPDIAMPVHPLVEAVHSAFEWHLPLTLSPDDIWLCLAQGFAMHVEANAVQLRSRFVAHDGQRTLMIIRDEFVRGSPDNDWQGCFAEWSDQIAAHIGKKRDLIVADFSTTGPIERAASEIVLMSAMKSYFNYLLVTRCGIPEITLLGTVADWQSIRRRAELFAEFDLGDWARAVLPVLDQFVAATSGNVDRAFWQSIYKVHDESGGPYITGWINALFPYLDGIPGDSTIERNPLALSWTDAKAHGTTLGRFPAGRSRVPLAWKYLGTVIPMMLQAGFLGMSQDPDTCALRPTIGWVVHAA